MPAAKVKAPIKKVTPKGDKLTQSELYNNLAAETGLSKKDAKAAILAIGEIGRGELKKGRKFVIPGIARFVQKKKPARPARKGRNPFTGEEMMFKAKPASKVTKAYVVKVFKEL